MSDCTINKTGLWCMNIIGPDDVYAAPDFWTALAWSTEVNGALCKRAVIEKWAADEHMPLSHAVPAPWPWSADSHAAALKEEMAAREEHKARRSAAQAMETRQGGDAEGGSVVDDSAVTEGDVPQADPSSEIEGLVDALIYAVNRHWTALMTASGSTRHAGRELQAARTALLSRLSPTPTEGDLAALSKKATQGEWSTFVNRLVGDEDEDGWSTIAETPAPASPTGSARRRQWENDAAFIAALVNAYRSGRLVERPTADATNPQE